MANITRIEGYDDYGYKVMDAYLPTMDEAMIRMKEIGEYLVSYGISAAAAADALRNVSSLMASTSYIQSEICTLKDQACDLQYQCEMNDNKIDCHTAALEIQLSELRSALDEKTVIPNQKDDLEISNRIIPSEEFLILGEVGWSADIINLNETNMFLN